MSLEPLLERVWTNEKWQTHIRVHKCHDSGFQCAVPSVSGTSSYHQSSNK